MSLFKFNDDDIFINTVEGYPEYRVIIHSGSVIIDDVPDQSGSNLGNILATAGGHVSLFERNIDKLPGQRQYAFLANAGYRDSFKIHTDPQHSVWNSFFTIGVRA